MKKNLIQWSNKGRPERLGTDGRSFPKTTNFARRYRRELPSDQFPGIATMVERVECDSPNSRTGMATTNPASGPAMARSNKARLFLGSCFIWMNAPMVPRGLKGRGIKYGRETAAPRARPTK